MGLGSSQEYYEAPPLRSFPSRNGAMGPATGAGRGAQRRRRRIFRRVRQAPTTIIPVPQPVRHHSPPRQHHHHHRPRQFPPAVPAFAPLATGVPSSLPMSYQNFTALPYVPPQSMLMAQQQMPPMMMPQQISQPYPMMAAPSRPVTMQRFAPMMMPQNLLQQQAMMMPQYMPQQSPMMMPQESPQSQAMRMAQQMPASIYSPYASTPYSIGASYSTPYAPQPVPQQPQVAPMYNNIGASVPAAVGLSGPVGPFSSPNRLVGPNLGTDWTGGGKISPGFLGPPL
ncbi:unnamed protein product [Adineta ricciae]|uniref:Uncharacterized protein n=1 Tax=Adineta ricciae TaxID=249248 RepID=A0A814M6P1_ADIRI|nr:unnamed protein product [Adineta ricciae]CAF1072523.1 unnamed protein product [Adineta ricciae]